MNAAVEAHTLYKSTRRRSLHPQLCHNVQRLTQSCQIGYALLPRWQRRRATLYWSSPRVRRHRARAERTEVIVLSL